MTSEGERDPLERLSEELLLRQRRGEAIDLEAFAKEHPDYAEQIRSLFPTMLQLEGAREAEPARAEERVGRWRILDELGRGGMGVVYFAEDGTTGERVALKLMTADHAAGAARFRREAEAAARLQHPEICRVLDVGSEGDRLWIAFEHLDGETMADALRRARRTPQEASDGAESNERDPAPWFEIAERVARALHATHEAGLLHRDIKPANIMLTADGRAVVLDFGLAHDDPTGERTRLTHTGVPVGTPAYMSPEQVHARPSRLNARTDVYSLGATLYEALTLRPPFEGPTVASLFSQILTTDPQPARTLNPALSRDQALVVATALEKLPERRYKTALDFADDLARARAGTRVRARPVSALRRLATWAVRNPAPAAIAASITLALATGLVVALSLLSVIRGARDDEAATARAARSRALASASAATLRADASLSLLLARAAVQAQRSPDTISQLHAAVHGSLERARLTGHDAAVSSLAWSADGTMLATGCDDGRARLFNAAGTHLCTVPPEGNDTPLGPCRVALSPSASRFTTLQADRKAQLWSAAGVLIAQLGEQTGPVHEVQFLDDDTVATVGIQGQVALHDAAGSLRKAWRIVPEEEAKGRVVYAIVVSQEPPTLHILTGRAIALSYDRHGTEVRRRSQAEGQARAFLFDGGRLAYGGPPPEADPHSETRPMLRVLTPDGQKTDTLPRKLDRNSKFCGADTWWCVWSRAEGATILDRLPRGVETHVLDMQRSERPDVLSASPDGGRLCTVRLSQSNRGGGGNITTDPIRLWTPRGAPLGHVATTEELAADARLSPDGERLAVGWHSGGLVTLHATASEELATGVPRWRGHRAHRYLPMVTADGRKMVYLHDGRRVRVLGEDGTEVAHFDLDSPARNLNFDSSRDLLLSTGLDGVSCIHDLEGTLLHRQPSKPSVLGALWLGKAGGFLTAVPGRIRFHDEHGSVVAEVEGRGVGPPPNRAYENEVAIASSDRVKFCAPDGEVLREYVLESDERPFRYCGSRSGRSLLMLGTGRVNTVCRYLDAQGKEVWNETVVALGNVVGCISEDGSRVVLAASGGLQIRDAAGTEVARLPLPGGLSSVAFDKAGTRIVASSRPGLVRIWDRDGRWLFDLPSQEGASIVGFSADGRRLATVTNALARLFAMDVDELEELAVTRSTREFTPAERIKYAEILEPKR